MYHFEKRSKDLFRNYIDTFLQVKQEASGWPAQCTTEESKEKYLKDYKNIEGIELDPKKITYNPGLRTVGKLALNSFWGRWGMNENKVHRVFLTEEKELNRLLSDSKIIIRDFLPCSDEVIEVAYSHKDNFLPQKDITNLFLASFTTAHARIKLYGVLSTLNRNVLYYDTDSVIYISDGNNDPALGDYLGEFTNELPPNQHIVEFASAGPKNYGYRLSNDKTLVKVRGFTLNYRSSQALNLESMKDMVLNNQDLVIEVVEPLKINRCKKRKVIFNKTMSKKYGFVYNKRKIGQNYVTYPYGFKC